MSVETQEAVTCVTCRAGRGTLLRCARCGYASHRACGRRTACPVSTPTMPCVHRFFSKAARVQATLSTSPLDEAIARVFSARMQSQLAKLDLPVQSSVFVELLDMARWADDANATNETQR